jgi:hypothetical protein
MITKRFRTYVSPWNLGLSYKKKSTLFLGEGALLLKELALFLKENSLLPKEVVIFTRELFLLHWELV